MKKILNLFVLVAAAAMALISCQKNEIVNGTPQEFEYTFLIGNADTKAGLGEASVEWENEDMLGLYTVKTSGEVSYNTKGFITPGNPATMKVYSFNALAAGDMIYAYYPYSSSNAQVPTEVVISLPTNQDGKDDMPLASLPMVVTSDIPVKENVDVEAGEIKLVNLAAIAEFNVYSSNEAYQSEKVESIKFTANKAIAGNFTFNLKNVDYSDVETLEISGYEATEVISTLSAAIMVGSTSDAAAKVKMVVAPGEDYTGTVEVVTDKATYTFDVTKSKTFVRSSVLPLAVDLAKAKDRKEAIVEPTPEGEVIDVLNLATTGITGTTYKDWSGKKSNSLAVYKGQSAGGNDAIQLRSNNSNSGIVTTASGGTIKKIVVVWNSNTAEGRTLEVYGKSSAYSAATELYSTSTYGTNLGSIVKGISTELVIDGTYEYLGLRSKSGAMYLDEIQITWSTSGEDSETQEPEPVQLGTPSVVLVEDAITENSLTFSWESVANASKYMVTFNNGAPMESTQTSYTVTGLEANTEYNISVVAVGDGTNYIDSTAGTCSGTTASAQGGDVEPEETQIVTIDLTAQGLTNGQEVSLVTVAPISVAFEKGENSNSPKYYTTGEAVRVYGGGYFTVSSIAGAIKTIEITFGSGEDSNTISTDCGTYSTPKWSGSASDVKFTIGGTTGNRRIQKLVVTYVVIGDVEPTQLDAPEVKCSEKTSNSLTFAWASVTNAKGYEVSFNGGEPETISKTTYIAENLDPETEYEISVKAVGDGTYYLTSEAANCTGTTEAEVEPDLPGEGGVKTYTLTIDANSFNTSSYAANNNEKTSTATATDGSTMDVKWTSNQVMKQSNAMQWQKSKGYIYNSTDLGTITDITITSSAGTFTKYINSTEKPSSNGSGGYFQIKVGSATGSTSKIVVTFQK